MAGERRQDHASDRSCRSSVSCVFEREAWKFIPLSKSPLPTASDLEEQGGREAASYSKGERIRFGLWLFLNLHEVQSLCPYLLPRPQKNHPGNATRCPHLPFCTFPCSQPPRTLGGDQQRCRWRQRRTVELGLPWARSVTHHELLWGIRQKPHGFVTGLLVSRFSGCCKAANGFLLRWVRRGGSRVPSAGRR